jgi:hypothetical protein
VGRELCSRPTSHIVTTGYRFFFAAFFGAAFFTAFFAAFFLAGNFHDPLSARRGCRSFGTTYHPG